MERDRRGKEGEEAGEVGRGGGCSRGSADGSAVCLDKLVLSMEIRQTIFHYISLFPSLFPLLLQTCVWPLTSSGMADGLGLA